MILNNLQTQKTPEVHAWLEAHARFHLHFTPTNSSRLNAVEQSFRDLTTQRLKRGVLKNVDALEAALVAWLDTRNDDPKPVKSTKTVEQIVRKVRKYRRIYQALH